jgi:acylphosphatase
MQAKIFVLGFVQNVGFRQFVKKNAQNLNLKGYVQNLPDGRVEALVQGEKSSIEKLIRICGKGVFLSEVKGIVVDYEEAQEEFQDFQILR